MQGLVPVVAVFVGNFEKLEWLTFHVVQPSLFAGQGLFEGAITDGELARGQIDVPEFVLLT